MSRQVVLDAWPVMEWFRGRRPAAEKFEELLTQAAAGHSTLCMSRINLGEVFYSAAKMFGENSAAGLVRQFRMLPIEIIPATDLAVDAAALLKERYRISYADAFAAALSMDRGAILVTGDVEFRTLAEADVLEVLWVGA